MTNVLAMLGDDRSLDQDAADDVKDELKLEWAILNGALKGHIKNWDFTEVIRPLLADQGPATAVVLKLKKQIERMTNTKDDFLRREEGKSRLISCVQTRENRQSLQQKHSCAERSKDSGPIS